MKRHLQRLALIAGLAWTASAHAHPPAPEAPTQDAPPPRGPADIIRRAQAQRAASAKQPLDMAQAAPQAGAPAQPAQPAQPALPPGHPPVNAGDPQPSAAGELPPGHPPVNAGELPPSAADELPPGHPPVNTGDARDARDAPAPANELPPGHPAVEGDDQLPGLSAKPLASADADPTLPVGTIRVRVVDENENPVAGANVQVGTMSQDSGRTSLPGTTGADGTFTYQKLATGERLAYRVNLLYQGAKTSCTPFRLPDDHGYQVTLRRLPVTHDAQKLVLYVGATSIEIKDERLKIVQQARLLNVGTKTYVFPDKGLLVPLPHDMLAFQSDAVMTDQHLAEAKGSGFTITGSIAPGEITLTWGFDVPRSGTEADLKFDIPWPTFAYRVLVDAAPSLRVDIDGMPAPQLHEDDGRRFLVSESVRARGEPPMRSLHVHLSGIPGPGPLRFIATALGLLVIGFGVVIGLRAPERTREQNAGLIAQRKQALLARASQLKAEHAQGEIGPEFLEQALSQLEEELAALLYEQAKLPRK